MRETKLYMNVPLFAVQQDQHSGDSSRETTVLRNQKCNIKFQQNLAVNIYQIYILR